ncbi:hypothetical protein BWK62_14435 [Flavobacterium oreochromis]|uniref:Uncharacterized protein n=3 Tax=Flavobacterium TaxID=237 RepID=A0A246G7F8_9FLAO|nr:hypothetical protein BWK62_14435 [Flavobacterium oreochromis]
MPQTKNKSMLFKITLSGGLIILIIVTAIILNILAWNSSTSPSLEGGKELENIKNKYKTILFKNLNKSRVDLEMNFEYTHSEIKEKKLDILDYYNTINLLTIEPQKEILVIIPIKKGYNQDFPERFNIILKDSTSKVIEKYDEQKFLRKAKSIPQNTLHKTKANEWILELK